MPRFIPYTPTSKLPPEHEGIERAILDLKLKGQAKPGFHVAKDIAAFANHVGGTLLIGAKESQGTVEMYEPLDAATATAVQKAASEAVRDRLSPKPIVDFARIARGEGVVLAVNVEPYAGGQAVGVSVKTKDLDDDFKGDAFVFPVRTAVDTAYLLPEQLPMFAIPEIRRTVIILNSVPEGSTLRLRVKTRNGGYTEGDEPLRIERVDELRNRVTFKDRNGNVIRSIPLDQIVTVFESHNRGWYIQVEAYE